MAARFTGPGCAKTKPSWAATRSRRRSDIKTERKSPTHSFSHFRDAQLASPELIDLYTERPENRSRLRGTASNVRKTSAFLPPSRDRWPLAQLGQRLKRSPARLTKLRSPHVAKTASAPGTPVRVRLRAPNPTATSRRAFPRSPSPKPRPEASRNHGTGWIGEATRCRDCTLTGAGATRANDGGTSPHPVTGTCARLKPSLAPNRHAALGRRFVSMPSHHSFSGNCSSMQARTPVGHRSTLQPRQPGYHRRPQADARPVVATVFGKPAKRDTAGEDGG